jgi:hypothetical protein
MSRLNQLIVSKFRSLSRAIQTRRPVVVVSKGPLTSRTMPHENQDHTYKLRAPIFRVPNACGHSPAFDIVVQPWGANCRFQDEAVGRMKMNGRMQAVPQIGLDCSAVKVGSTLRDVPKSIQVERINRPRKPPTIRRPLFPRCYMRKTWRMAGLVQRRASSSEVGKHPFQAANQSFIFQFGTNCNPQMP